jgi:hypothetical protein
MFVFPWREKKSVFFLVCQNASAMLQRQIYLLDMSTYQLMCLCCAWNFPKITNVTTVIRYISLGCHASNILRLNALSGQSDMRQFDNVDDQHVWIHIKKEVGQTPIFN